MKNFNLTGSENAQDLFSNISQYFNMRDEELDQDENAFIRNDCSELIGELEGIIQRMDALIT